MKFDELYKLYELDETQNFSERDSIEQILQLAFGRDSFGRNKFVDIKDCYHINNDGHILLNSDFILNCGSHGSDPLLTEMQASVPLKIDTACSVFSISGQRNIKTLNWLPRISEYRIAIDDTGITSLVGINDIVESMDGSFRFTPENIKSGGIGLILIVGLSLVYTNIQNSVPFKIIARYIGRPEDIFECQSELIEAGYEAIAQL